MGCRYPCAKRHFLNLEIDLANILQPNAELAEAFASVRGIEPAKFALKIGTDLE
jgi:hypothetical protein